MSLAQSYVSNELTHFVGRGLQLQEQYSLLVKIIKSGIVKPGENFPDNLVASAISTPTGVLADNTGYLGDGVCFCDIPENDFEIHMRKYSRFGLAFHKSFLITKGANPVFYIARNSWVARSAFGKNQSDRSSEFNQFQKVMDLVKGFMWKRPNPIPQLVSLLSTVSTFMDFNVLSYIKFFDPNLPEDDPDNYYMEREWRIRGAVKFQLDDICRIILPSSFEGNFRLDVPEFNRQVSFSDGCVK